MRLLHLVGSPVSEFHADLSRMYARGCLQMVADQGRHESLIGYVRPDGRWCFPAGLTAEELRHAPTMTVAEAIANIVAAAPDAVVPQLFDLPGMTSFRSLFEVLGLPLLGNPGPVMAIAADKALTKAVVAGAGVATPESEVLRAGEPLTLGLPVVVKPADADNSQGVTLVRDPGGVDAALEAALRWSDRALVERFVPLGREVRCAVLDLDGELTCLPLEEYQVDATDKPIRGGDDKLAASGDALSLVAKDAAHAWIVAADDPVVAPVHAAARAAHVALGARHYSLFDFRIDPAGRPWFLEAGLYCSFSPQSVVAVMADAAGLAVAELFDRVLTEALRPQRTA